MREFALGIIRGRRRSLAEGEQLGPDLISRFLESAKKLEARGVTDDETILSDDELVDVVLNFLIAGRDTTACALSWASFRLIRGDQPRRHMQAEVAAAEGAADPRVAETLRHFANGPAPQPPAVLHRCE